MSLLSWLQNPKSEDPESNETPKQIAPILAARLQEFSGATVASVMTPRALVVALDADVQLRRVRRLKSSRVSYFPVYQGDLDNVLGWVSKVKVLELLAELAEDVRLIDHVKPVGVIDENASVTELADEFLKASSPFLVVTNAQGTVTGLMTLSEFVELIFGIELESANHTAPSENAPSPLLRSYEL